MSGITGLKLNKGEWAEFYAMLKLLGEGRLYTANELLEKNYACYLDIIKVIREEVEGNVIEYIIDKESSSVVIKEKLTDRVLAVVPENDFDYYSDLLFEDIKNKSGASIAAPEAVCEFAEIILVSKPKAPSVKALEKQFGGKNDIFIEARDSQTAIVSVMGFSIKSRFGDPPTLFNAGTSSQLMFRLDGCNKEIMEHFNSIRDDKGKRGWSNCIDYLKEKDVKISYYTPKNPIFKQNLYLVRERMEKVLALCVIDRLFYNYDNNHNVKETIERISSENQIGDFTNSIVYFEKAIKDFLMASFTGLTAGKKWDGTEQVNGGYIVVMENSDVLCYHSVDREKFKDYLYKNTHFEYVSANKYKWSYIEEFEDNFYLPLNISIRFNKELRN